MLEDIGNIKEQGERGRDGEVRQGLVLMRKKAAHQALVTRLLGCPSRPLVLCLTLSLETISRRLWGLWLSCGRFQVLLQYAPEC